MVFVNKYKNIKNKMKNYWHGQKMVLEYRKVVTEIDIKSSRKIKEKWHEKGSQKFLEKN